LAGNDIKQKIVLEGEKEYNQALKDAQRNLKTLRSELKAETAELGANATAQQKNEVKAKSLQKQIKEQEKVVKTYQEALAEVKEKYGDNEDAVAKWEQKLNDARTTLANMRNSLEDTGRSMKSVGDSAQMGVVAANSFADSLGKVAEAGASISGALENAFKSVVSTITTAIGDVWADVLDIAAKADNYLDLAAFLGASATDVQKWSKAMETANGDISTVVNLISRLKYGGKADKVAEWFGISDVKYTNDLEYFQQVVQQMYDMKKTMSDEKWGQALADIFGAKKVQDIENILSDWEQISDGLNTYDPEKGGYGLTEDQIEQMASLEEQVNRLTTKWEALKEMATVHLSADLAMNITGDLENIVDAFKEYFEATDDEGRAQAIEKIKENVVSIITALKDGLAEGLKALDELAEEFKGSEDSTVRAIGNVLGTIVDALEWFTDENNWETVKKGFETLIGVWAAGKIAAAVGNLASFAAHITTISGAMGGGGLGALGGGGIGSMLTSMGYLAVGVMMVAPAVQKLLDPNFWNKEEKPEVEGAAEAVKEAGISTQDLLKTGFARAFYTGGDASGLATPKGNREKEEEKAPYNGPRSVDGVGIPVIRKPLELTAEQIEAAERFWDNWRNFKFTGQGEYSFDKAWDNFEKAFVGDESKFNLLNDLMDKLMASIDSAGVDGLRNYQDLPASWWMNPNGENNGLTSEDISGFRGLPAQMLQAVKSGSAAGVSGIKVTLDGRTVGMMVAPYVSEVIAREIQ